MKRSSLKGLGTLVALLAGTTALHAAVPTADGTTTDASYTTLASYGGSHSFGDHGLISLKAHVSGTKLYVAIQGDAEANFNELYLILNHNAATGAAAGVALPNGSDGGSPFTSFNPTLDIEADFGVRLTGGNSANAFVSVIDYRSGGNTDTFLGTIADTGALTTVAGGAYDGTQIAYNRVNLSSNTGQGLELVFDLVDLGATPDSTFNFLALYGADDFISSDTIPEAVNGTNLATDPSFAGYAGVQASTLAPIVFNEFDTNTSATEYIELYNPSSAAVSLSANEYVMVFLNGNGDLVYQSTDLTGTIPAYGYYLLAESGVVSVGGQTPDQNATWTSFQNGNTAAEGDGIALVKGGTAAGFPAGVYTTSLSAISGAFQSDAVIYSGTGPVNDTGLNTQLGLTFGVTNGAGGSTERISDGQGGANFRYLVTDWQIDATRSGKLANSTNLIPEVEVLDGASNVALGATINLGSTTQGGAAITRTFTVNNLGASSLDTSNMVLPASYSATEALNASIAAAGTDNFTIEVPSSTLGTFAGRVAFNNSDRTENPYYFNVTADVVLGASPEIAVSETTFGNIPDAGGPVLFTNPTFGGANAVLTITVNNTGTADLNIASVVVSGDAEVVAGSDALNAVIGSGLSDTFTVELGTTTLGLRSGTVTITCDDSDEATFDFGVQGTVVAGAAPTLTSVVPSVSGNSIDLVFSKAMTTTGTYTPAPDTVNAVGNTVTLGYTTPLAGYPTITAFTVAGATATDAGSFTGNFSAVGQEVTPAQIHASVDVNGVSALEGATGTDNDGAWVSTRSIIVEKVLDLANQRNTTIAGSPGITVRGSANGTWTASAVGDLVVVAGQVTSFNGLQEIINVSAGNPLVSTVSSGNTPAVTTIGITDSANTALNEPLESSLVRINDVHFETGPGANFPTQSAGSGVNYTIARTGTTPTLTLRIDRDVSNLVVDGFDGQVAPTGDFDVIGIMQQFDNSNPFTDGYQLIPIGYSGILPASSVTNWMILDAE